MDQTERVGHPRDTGIGATLKRTFAEFKEDGLPDWAAALTYYGVLSVFPALLALVSLAGLIGDPQSTVQTLLGIVQQVASPTIVDAVRPPLTDIAQSGSTALVLLIAGLVAALWSASRYVGGFMRASNVMYEVHEGRPIWKARPLQMLVTLLMLLTVVAATIAIVVTGSLASAIGDAIGVGSTAVTVWNIVKWPVIALFVIGAISIMYYASPNAKVRGFKSVLPGAAVALVVWVVASAAFAFYVANFGSFNETYGTLGGIIIFLIWLWLTNVAVLIGAEFNVERERDRQLREGVADAEHGLRLGERQEPAEKQKPRTV